jgi:threonine/homoserine/homoserine lactone efflux protein
MRVMETFASFLAVAALAIVVPGPDTFVVLRTSLTDGAKAGTWAAAGSGTGNLVWGGASVLGVAGLLAASATLFSVFKLAGAVYLVVLGVQALVAGGRGDTLAGESGTEQRASARAAFRRGLASDLVNVKVGLFWTALVPQFVSGDSSAVLPLAMVVSMAAMGFAWLAAYARLAARLTPALRRRRVSRAVNGTVGVALTALGARLALAH